MECPFCFKIYDDQLDSCPFCGSKKPKMLICPKCHYQTNVYNFCPNCGTELVKEIDLTNNHYNEIDNSTKIKKQLTFDDIFRSLKPTSEDYRNEGDEYYKKDNMEEAIKYYNHAIDIADTPLKKAQNYCWKGKRLIEKGMINDGLSCFDEGIRICPTYIGNWYEKGTYMFVQENYEESSICFKKLTELDSTEEIYWTYRITCLEELGIYEEALECCHYQGTILSRTSEKSYINKIVEIQNKLNNSSKELDECQNELKSLEDEIQKLSEEFYETKSNENEDKTITEEPNKILFYNRINEKNMKKINLNKKIKNLKEIVKRQKMAPLISHLDASILSNAAKKSLKNKLIEEEWNKEKLDEEMSKIELEERDERKEAEFFSKINNSSLDENHQKRLRRKVKKREIFDMDILIHEIKNLERIHR